MKRSILLLAFCLCTSFMSCAKEQQDTLKMPVLASLSDNEIRIVSYNLLFEKTLPDKEEQRWSRRYNVVKSMFKNYSFDIVGSQEAVTFQVNQVMQIDDYGKIGGDLATGGTDNPKAENEAIFYKKSRFDVLESGNFWFSTTPDKPGSFGWDATYPRMCTWGKFRVKSTGKIFYVFNSHFHTGFDQSRLESAKILLSKIREVANDYPVFCTGDLNSPPDSESIQVLLGSGVLDDSRDLASEKTGPIGTFHGFNTSQIPTKRIDFVFINNKIEVSKYRVLDQELSTGNFGSDHLPVVVDAKIK